MSKNNIQTNLLGRRAKIHERWFGAAPGSPYGRHWEQWGEVVVVRNAKDSVQLTLQWDDGELLELGLGDVQLAPKVANPLQHEYAGS